MTTEAWDALIEHAANPLVLKDMFADDPARADAFTFESAGIVADFSKQRVTAETVDLLLGLAHERGVRERIDAMFAGERINVSEDRAVLHVELRAPRGEHLVVDGQDVVAEVHEALDKMVGFANAVRDGEWRGHTGRRIRNVVNIGIGGSDLGPRMAYETLRDFAADELDVRFVSNVDGADLTAAVRGLDASETLFVVCSKSWHTIETLTNATHARDWLVNALGEAAVGHHFVAVSTNLDDVEAFGIDRENAFPMWDWVGGRYSFDSAVGLALMVGIGPVAFGELLAGFHEMDEHFRDADFASNLPVLMAMIGVWNTNFLGAETLAVLPYAAKLERLPAYLQQLEMESNGKHVDMTGTPVQHHTGPIVWGQPGTNGQHAFYQLIHQGTREVPCDLIGVIEPLSPLVGQHDLLMANLFAQAEALAFGRSEEELRAAGAEERTIPFRVCEGNRPTTMLLLDALTPRALGRLVALYEHKVFVQGVIWDIDSFDQWGVELGKELAQRIMPELEADTEPTLDHHDSSTASLIRRYRASRGR